MSNSSIIYGYDPYKAKNTYINAMCNRTSGKDSKDFIKKIQMFNNDNKIGAMNIICNSGDIKTIGNPNLINGISKDKITEIDCSTGFTDVDVYATQDDIPDNYISGLGFKCNDKYITNPQNCTKTHTFKCEKGNLKGIEALYNSDNIKSIRFLCEGDKSNKNRLFLNECNNSSNSLQGASMGIMFAIFLIVVMLAIGITLLPDRSIRNITKI